MFGTILALLFNPAALIVVALVVAGLAILWFAGGPVMFWKVLRDVRLWLAVVFVAMFVTIGNLKDEVTDLKEEVRTEQVQGDATQDAQATVEGHVRRQRAQADQNQRIDDAVDAAPEGEKFDAFLDQVAREQAAEAADRPRAQPEPADDGVRKQPGAVVP